ncbi:MAG: 1-acyl-sn-glycerol-3-phosphate acyltransferase [Nitrospira sp.]|nr:1-acyl-sn-glycerol-3-phosphate acyltransferase [Nitrospira sp.]
MPSARTGCLTRIGRGIRLIGKLFEAFILVCLVFPRIESSRHDGIIERWCREVLDILHITVSVHGRPMPGKASPVMFVANHISWLDVLLLNACRRMHFVAKMEVRSWPLIGWIAAGTGTLFFKRTAPHQLARVMQSMTAALGRGDCIALFPEGTTTDGVSVHTFHSGLFESAIQADVPIRPVGISYLRSDGSLDADIAFVGDESLVSSILNVLSRPTTLARLSFSNPIDSSIGDRRRLATLCQRAVERSLADLATLPPASNASPLCDMHGPSSPAAAA